MSFSGVQGSGLFYACATVSASLPHCRSFKGKPSLWQVPRRVGRGGGVRTWLAEDAWPLYLPSCVYLFKLSIAHGNSLPQRGLFLYGMVVFAELGCASGIPGLMVFVGLPWIAKINSYRLHFILCSQPQTPSLQPYLLDFLHLLRNKFFKYCYSKTLLRFAEFI